MKGTSERLASFYFFSKFIFMSLYYRCPVFFPFALLCPPHPPLPLTNKIEPQAWKHGPDVLFLDPADGHTDARSVIICGVIHLCFIYFMCTMLQQKFFSAVYCNYQHLRFDEMQERVCGVLFPLFPSTFASLISQRHLPCLQENQSGHSRNLIPHLGGITKQALDNPKGRNPEGEGVEFIL